MILNATLRQEIGKAVAKLREAGKIPAVLYGHGTENKNLTLSLAEFEKVLNTAGESTLIDLKIENKTPIKILIQDFQRESVSHQIIHVDLHQVRMDEKLTTDVEIEFVGESSAVKDFGGILVKALDKVEIECLPGDLISNIRVDLANLKNIGDMVRIKDLNLGDKVTVLTDPEAPLVLVEEPKKEEEEKPVETETPEEGIEIKDENKEGEQTEEKAGEEKKEETANK